MMMGKLLQIIRTPMCYICVFISFKAYQGIEAYLQKGINSIIPVVFLVEVLLTIVAAFFALRCNRFSQWILGIFMLTHIIGVPFGLLIPLHQYVVKPVSIFFGFYFAYAGLLMLKEARKAKQLTPNQAL